MDSRTMAFAGRRGWDPLEELGSKVNIRIWEAFMRNVRCLSLVMLASFCLLEGQAPAALVEKLTYSGKGSKSESVHGYLLVDGAPLADVFTVVAQGKRLWRFQQRSHLWGADGYILAPEAAGLARSEELVASESLKRGWYVGKKRLQGTPEHWVYLEWQDGCAWADARSIGHVVMHFKLMPMARDKMGESLGIRSWKGAGE